MFTSQTLSIVVAGVVVAVCLVPAIQGFLYERRMLRSEHRTGFKATNHFISRED